MQFSIYYGLNVLLLLASLFYIYIPAVSLPFRGPVCNPFCAKRERIGCLGRITVDVSPPGNFKILEPRPGDFRL